MSRDAVRAGAILAYGRPVEVVPKLDAVDLLLTIDSDLFDVCARPSAVRPRFRRESQSRQDGSDEPGVCDSSRRRR